MGKGGEGRGGEKEGKRKEEKIERKEKKNGGWRQRVAKGSVVVS